MIYKGNLGWLLARSVEVGSHKSMISVQQTMLPILCAAVINSSMVSFLPLNNKR